MPMLGWLKRNAVVRRTGQQLYDAIVAQARQEAFYRDLGVADTMEGRFEIIVLHLVLALERLKKEGDAGQRVGQVVIERLIADMDDALRQIGIGDMGVPKRVQRAAAAVSERARDYDARQTEPGRLEKALKEHIFGYGTDGDVPAPQDTNVSALAAYVRACRDVLDAVPGPVVLDGRLAFAEIGSAR
jgi:cytochrome b pre-mRNA-processing protein 3